MSMKKGLDGVLKNLAKVDADVYRAVRRGVGEFCQAVAGEAQERAPIDTGALADDTKAGPVRGDGRRVIGTVGCGVAHALPVHENLEANFNTDRNPDAQPRFLYNAFVALSPKFEPVLEKKVARVLKQ